MKRALITSAILVLLIGCGATQQGTKEYDTANQLASVNQYGEAIAYLEQAVIRDPKNKKYAERLSELKGKYLQISMKEVQLVLSAEITNQKLQQAETILQDLAKVGIDNSETQTASEQVSVMRQQLYKSLEQEYNQAKNAMQGENWRLANELLQKIAARFTNYEDVQIRLKTVVLEANKYYLAQANSALANDNFSLARQYIADLQTIVANNPIAMSLLKKIEKNDNQEYFQAKALSAQEQGDWSQVIVNCQSALRYNNTSAECLEMLKSAKVKQAQFVSEAMLESMNEGRLVEAKSLFLQLKELNTLDYTNFEKLRDALSQQAEYSAESYHQQGQFAIASILLNIIKDINPAFPSLFNKIREIEDSISERSKRSIAVFDFNSPTNSGDAGIIVANNLISRLFNNASRDIKILERENLKSILEEMKLGQIGVVSQATAKEMGRVYGIDYAIMGSVLLYKVDENTSSSTKTIRYQIGKKIEDNIEYLNWRAANTNPSKSELKSAPLAKIMVPEFGEKEYQVTHTKKVGFLQLSYRIVNVLTGENTSIDTIERRVQIEDTSNAGVQDADIKFDAMEVPTDTEMMQKLTEEVVEQVASEVLRPLQQLETYYFNEGLDRERRTELDAAHEYYTYAIFNERLKSVSSSPITVEAQNRIDNIVARYRFINN